MRGTWTVAIHTDPEGAGGRQPDVPGRGLRAGPHRVRPDQRQATRSPPAKPPNVTVDGRFLYGAPAAGLALEGEVDAVDRRANGTASRAISSASPTSRKAKRRASPLTDLPLVGDDGKATFPVGIDQLPSTTRLLNAAVTVRMREAGGRAVERSLDIAIRPTADMIGIRPDFAGDEVPQGGTAKFSVIAVDPDGKRKALPGALWKLVKIERNYQWYRSGNSWNYEPVTFTKAVANGTIDIAADSEVSISQPVDWGRYRLEIETRRSGRPGDQLRVRCRLVCRGELDRDARRARNRARQGELRARRSGQAEGLAALCRRTAGHRRRRQAARPP